MQTAKLKTLLLIVAVSFVTVILVGVIFVLVGIHEIRRMRSTPVASGASLISNAGGVDRINAEATGLFAAFGPGSDLDPAMLREFPAFRALGSHSVLINSASGQLPRYIQVRYGTHFDRESIYIFDVNASAMSNWTAMASNETHGFQLYSNIFVTKR